MRLVSRVGHDTTVMLKHGIGRSLLYLPHVPHANYHHTHRSEHSANARTGALRGYGEGCR